MDKFINPEFVDTYESFSKGFFWSDRNIAIPYINIALMPENQVNNKVCFVQYSYYVFLDVISFEYGGPTQKFTISFGAKSISDPIEEYVIVGNLKDSGGEARILCKEYRYYLPVDKKISVRMNDFIPRSTPNFKQTMRDEEATNFFSSKFLPEEIKEILGNQFNSFEFG